MHKARAQLHGRHNISLRVRSGNATQTWRFFVEYFARKIPPKERRSHECAIVDDHLYLFGGYDGLLKYFPRDEIFVMNVREAEKKWIRRSATGRKIPPPCSGARCIVIDKMIYSYEGRTIKYRRLGIVYRLDPKEMEWIEVATPTGQMQPYKRSHCCLCAIGSRMVMFGGDSGETIPRDQVQSGATQDECNWSNDIYEFHLQEGKNEGSLHVIHRTVGHVKSHLTRKVIGEGARRPFLV